MASKKVSVILMAVAAVVMAVITLIEAYEGTGETPFRLYFSPWFIVLLIMVWVNLLLNMTRPWWWRKRQLPLSLCHLGFLLILTGGCLTWAFGLRGNLSISEGETKDVFRLSSPVLRLTAGNGIESRYVIKGKNRLQSMSWLSRLNPFAAKNEIKLRNSQTVSVLDRMSSSRLVSQIKQGPGGSGPAALVLNLNAKGMGSEQVVLLDGDEISIDHPSLSRMIYRHRPDEAPPVEDLSSLFSERIEIHPPGAPTIAIPLTIPEDVGHTFTEQGYTVKVIEYHPDFKMGQAPILDAAPRNPALHLDVSGPGGRATLYTFALFEFHGNQLPDGTEVLYHRPTGGKAFLLISRGADIFEVYTSAEGDPVRLSTDEPLILGEPSTQSELSVALAAFWPSSIMAEKIVQDPTGQGSPAYFVRVGADGEPTWLTPGGDEAVSKDGLTRAGLGYTYDLGFELTLDDAVAEFWPRSSIPKAYYSFVRITDIDNTTPEPARIETNHPLLKNGFRLYMSGMDQQPPYSYSVFAVSKDPGAPVVFVGFLLMTFGMLWLFWVRFIEKPLQAKRGGS